MRGTAASPLQALVNATASDLVGGAGRRIAGLPAVVVVPVVVVALGAVVGWWLTHAHAFEPVSAEVSISLRLGEMAQAGLEFGPLPGVEVTMAAAVVGEGSVPAALHLSLCEPRVDGDGPTVLGAARGPLSPHCQTVTDLVGADLGTVPPDTYLVVTVVPQAPGRVTMEGVDIEFRDGLRRGRQRIGPAVLVDTTSAVAAG